MISERKKKRSIISNKSIIAKNRHCYISSTINNVDDYKYSKYQKEKNEWDLFIKKLNQIFSIKMSNSRIYSPCSSVGRK
jgi:hypothetical protein